MFFSISYIVLTCYVYYYWIWLGFNMLFSCFLAGFLLFSSKWSVTGCDSSLGSFCYSIAYFLLLMHLHSGYYYYDYANIGVLRPSWFTEKLFWIGLLLSKEVKQLHYCITVSWRVDDFSFFDCSSPFCFLLIEFHYTFSISI